MALFPKIDQPCPLGIDEQKRIAGYCGRCSKTVHALDAMSDAERVALVGSARGSVCVSYRTRRTPGVGFGAAFALAVASPVFATDVLPVAVDRAAEQRSVDDVASPFTGAQPSGPKCKDKDDVQERASEGAQKLEFIISMGGVSRPEDADWIDDSTLPDLPVTVGTTAD
jgi:hypothetical protein